MYAMTTGNWSTQSAHCSGNMMAAAVAVPIPAPGVGAGVPSEDGYNPADDLHESTRGAVTHSSRVHPTGPRGPWITSATAARLTLRPVTLCGNVTGFGFLCPVPAFFCNGGWQPPVRVARFMSNSFGFSTPPPPLKSGSVPSKRRRVPASNEPLRGRGFVAVVACGLLKAFALGTRVTHAPTRRCSVSHTACPRLPAR